MTAREKRIVERIRVLRAELVVVRRKLERLANRVGHGDLDDAHGYVDDAIESLYSARDNIKDGLDDHDQDT